MAGRRSSMSLPKPMPRMMLPLLLLLMLLLLPALVHGCVLDTGNSIGSTLPSKAINLEPGQPFNITCLINPEHEMVRNYSSDDLYFQHKEVLSTGVVKTRVPADIVTKLNSTAIMVTTRLQQEAQHTFECFLNRRQLNTTGVCMTHVNVGRPPLKVKNFRCISYNWMNVNCTWEEPFNAIRTKYDVRYRLKTFPFYGKVCNASTASLPDPVPGQMQRRSCVVKKPEFRPTHQRFIMTMNASNALGTVDFPDWTLETYAIVLPAPPKSLRATNVTSHGLRLHVSVTHPMFAFPEPVLFVVTYTSPWDQQPVSVNASSIRGVMRARTHSLPVQDLVPFTNYTFSVRMRASRAYGEDMWSDAKLATFRTKPTIPAAAPTTTASSFQLVGQAGSRTVYVYWRQIEPFQENGDHFHYCVSAWRPGLGRKADLRPDQVTPAYAKFSDVTLESVTFRVTSCNEEGESEQAAYLTVPARTDVLARPHSVTVVVEGEGQYQISWKQRSHLIPDNYTVFWCQHTRDRPFQCEGQLQWTHVPGDTRSHLLEVGAGAQYQFAVAANKGHFSSGMTWSECTQLANGEAQYSLELYVEERGPRHLVLAWYGKCNNRAQTPQHAILYYCKLEDGHCLGNETRVEADPSAMTRQNLTVSDLEPFSNYRLSVAVVTADVEGQRSAAVDAETKQAQPQPPAAIQVIPTSNTTLNIQWSPPKLPNGDLENYTVHVGSLPPVTVPVTETEYNSTGLQAYTRYSVTVRACNSAWKSVGCSQPSRTVLARTKVGVPGAMDAPSTELLNVSAVRVSWRPPGVVGGPDPIYQLLVVSQRDGENHTRQLDLPGGTETTDLQVAECEPGSASQRHLFSVRASLQLSSGGRLTGPWSEFAQQSCVLASDWPTATIVGVVMGGALLMMLVVLVFFLLCSRTKKKIAEMRNLGVNLPAGLDRLEKPPLGSFPAAERRAGEGLGYGRLVSQNSASTERTSASVSGQPLLQEDLTREDCEAESSELTTPPQTDNNSCSSSATHYTDSGAECEKGAPSPTFKEFQWPAVTSTPSNITPYVQVGGPEAMPALNVTAAPPYSKLSHYVDAKGIQALLARSLEALPSDEAGSDVSRSVPDLAQPGWPPAATADPPAVLPYSQIGHRSSTGYVSMASDEAMAAAPRAAPAAYHQLDTAPPPQGKPQEAKSRPPQPAPPAAAAAAAAASKPAELKPYVTLGPPPPPASAAGFPPYVLAGPPSLAPEGPAPVGSCSPIHGGVASPLTWARPRAEEVHSAPAAASRAAAGAAAEAPTREVTSAGYVMHDKLRPAGIEMSSLAGSTGSSGYVSQEALHGDTPVPGEPVLSPKKLPTVASSRDPYCRVVTTHQGPPDLGPNVSMV